MPQFTPLKAIRAKCLDCSGGSYAGIRDCPMTDCPLWPYRMGHNPNRAGVGGNPQLKLGVLDGKRSGRVESRREE